METKESYYSNQQLNVKSTVLWRSGTGSSCSRLLYMMLHKKIIYIVYIPCTYVAAGTNFRFLAKAIL